MYNAKIYNSKTYNLLTISGGRISDDTVSFNGFSLNNGETIITTNLFYESIDSDFVKNDKPNDNGQIFSRRFFRKKQIKISGKLLANSQTELELLIKNFKKEVVENEGYLDIITANGERRRFICTLQNSEFVDRGKHWQVTVCDFDLDFECSSPFGSLLLPSTTSTSSTSLATSGVLVNTGNAPAELDIIITFASAVSVTALNFKNTTTDDEIEITESITTGDIVRIRRYAGDFITINGVGVDFAGKNITANAGNNAWLLTITGTSATVSITINTPINFL